MTDLERALEDIAQASSGPKVAAFLDFDGTLVAGYSATAFAEEQLRRREVSLPLVADILKKRLQIALNRTEQEELIRASMRGFAGRTVAELEEIGERLFTTRIAGTVHPEARELVFAHQRKGHTVVIASSASRYQVQPLARDLGIEHVLCTELETRSGRLTGEVKGPMLWGTGKADAVRAFARRRRLALGQAFGYGNGNEDVAFLEQVGHPRAVNPGTELARTALERKWQVLRFRSQRAPDAELVARSVAGVYGIGAATLAGLGVGLLLNRDRRQALNLVTTLAPEIALPLAGVRVRVAGEDNLWKARPAVFIFNHQSYLDGMVLAQLLRQDFTAVAKTELQRLPGFNVVGWLADFAWVDRSNGRQAKEALKPVVDRLRSGVSLVIAPEGTRSSTHTVAPFKKGAFHVARQAGVPIVPIVIRNSGDLLWKRSLLVRPGTIDVEVLPPIDVSGWKLAELEDRIAEVRSLFVSRLRDWAAGDVGVGRRARATGGRRAR